MNKKILLTSFPLESNFGGGEKVSLILAKSYRKKGIEVSFWGSCPVLAKEFRKLRISSIKAFFIKDLTSLKSLLLSPFFILSLLLQSLFRLPYFRIRGFRTVLMLSIIEQIFLTIPLKIIGVNVFWWHNLPVRKSLIKNPFFPVWLFCSRFITLLVPTEAMRAEFNKIGVGNISIVSNVVDFSFNHQNKDKNFFNNNLNKKDKKLRAGMLCRLSPEKGIFDFLKLASQFPEYEFLIAGKGNLRKEIEHFIEKHNLENVILLGFIPPGNVNKYLESLDIFCVFSEYESFGIVAAEASYAGVPVLASNVGGIPEVVLDGKTGLLFEYGNLDEIKQKFLILLKNKKLRIELGKAGQKHVRENYLPKHLIVKMNEILFNEKKIPSSKINNKIKLEI